jgi:hypothetical protein
MYLPDILNPLALTKVDEAAQRQADLEDQTVIDEIATALYRRHRSESKKSKVRERTWDTLPNSEKGKYRGIVRDAIAKYKRTRH